MTDDQAERLIAALERIDAMLARMPMATVVPPQPTPWFQGPLRGGDCSCPHGTACTMTGCPRRAVAQQFGVLATTNGPPGELY